jgi:hypothetical protein
MPLPKKKVAQKLGKSNTVVVIRTRIAAKDTLFPEKVAKAKKILRNAEFLDSRFRGAR